MPRGRVQNCGMSTETAAPLHLTPVEGEPLVSVLVANYNYAGYIGEALQSVLEQSYSKFEVVVCDDGSTDHSREVVERYAAQDQRIRLIRKENGGAASALNRAYEGARGEILCVLDADDTFYPAKLGSVVDAFRENEWGLLVHPLMVVDSDGEIIQRKPAFSNFEEGWIADDVARRGARWTYMEASAICLRRSVASLVFPIPEDDFRSWADAYVCTMAAMVAPVGYVDRALATYRLHGANVSGFSSLDADHGEKAMDGYRRLVRGVNERVRSLGLSTPAIRVEDNLAYLESLLQAQLFRPSTPLVRRVRTYAAYCRALVSDDLYGPARKLLSLFFFGTAFFLPIARRAGWVSAGLTHSRLKQRILQLLHRARAQRRAF
jgi:glycosyltransferase involved in cell wall biosynthesis